MNLIPPILQYIPHYIWTKVINNCGAAIAIMRRQFSAFKNC